MTVSDIDVAVNDLSEFLSGMLRIGPAENRSTRNFLPAPLIGISTNIHARTLDESLAHAPEKQYSVPERSAPLIDVIEDDCTVRIIATLQGIRKEDMWFEMKKDSMVVEITKHGTVYKKEVLCNARAGQVLIKSSTLNNSVLEIVLEKASRQFVH